MPVVRSRFLFRSRPGRHSTRSSVVGHAVYCDVLVNHRFVVDIVNVHHVHVGYRPVIKEVSSIPTSAYESDAEIAEPIIDPSIETDMRTQKTVMEQEEPVLPAPPGRGPKKSDFGRQHPCARNPVIVVAIPSPIARSPKVAITRTNRLFIDRKRGGPE